MCGHSVLSSFTKPQVSHKLKITVKWALYSTSWSGGRSRQCSDLSKYKWGRQEGIQLHHGEVWWLLKAQKNFIFKQARFNQRNQIAGKPVGRVGQWGLPNGQCAEKPRQTQHSTDSCTWANTGSKESRKGQISPDSGEVPGHPTNTSRQTLEKTSAILEMMLSHKLYAGSWE